MSGAGRLVAVCGIDGSGKTFQTARLKQRAEAAGWRVETISFPCYEGFFGGLVARYLRGEFGSDPRTVSPYLAAVAFACDRWQAAPSLRDWLAEGALVVCNRYVPSNLAHQGSKLAHGQERDRFLRWVEQMEYDVFGLPRPDLQVLLDVPPDVARALIGRKEERSYLKNCESDTDGPSPSPSPSPSPDIHESDTDYLQSTREVYLELASADDRWLRVDCAPAGRMLEPDVIANLIWQRVQRLLAPEPGTGG